MIPLAAVCTMDPLHTSSKIKRLLKEEKNLENKERMRARKQEVSKEEMRGGRDRKMWGQRGCFFSSCCPLPR